MGFTVMGTQGFKIDFSATVNPTIVNGILTANAVVFGFFTFEAREIEKNSIKRFLLILAPLSLLMFSVHGYFVDALTLDQPTVWTMLWITTSFFYIILYQIALLVFKEFRDL